MADTTAIVFQTHFFDRWCLRAFRAVADRALPHQRPVVVMHLPPGVPAPPLLASVPHHVVRTDTLRTPDYPAKTGGPEWNLWRGGHTDLIPMSYWRLDPGHRFYWFIEYDVRFSGDWRHFLSAYDDDPTDLLAPAIVTRADDPDWYNWPSLAGPERIPDAMQTRCFLPVIRASAALMREMDACYRAGWTGHCEATWPSFARRAGLTVADLGGHGPFTPPRYWGLHYTCTPLSPNLAPGSFVFKPGLYRMGSRPNMLWHPVKPFFWREELQEGLRDMVRRTGVLLRCGAARAGLPLPGWMQPGGIEKALETRRARRGEMPRS